MEYIVKLYRYSVRYACDDWLFKSLFNKLNYIQVDNLNNSEKVFYYSQAVAKSNMIRDWRLSLRRNQLIEILSIAEKL